MVELDVLLDLLVLYRIQKFRGIPLFDLIDGAVPFPRQIERGGRVIVDVGERYKVAILRADPYL